MTTILFLENVDYFDIYVHSRPIYVIWNPENQVSKKVEVEQNKKFFFPCLEFEVLAHP